MLCRTAESNAELQACALLRVASFYVYPPERAFAGQVGLPSQLSLLLKRSDTCETVAVATNVAISTILYVII